VTRKGERDGSKRSRIGQSAGKLSMTQGKRNYIRDYSHPDFNHATLGGYQKGCRCLGCKRARADYNLKQKGVESPAFKKLLGMPTDHPDFPHGTRTGYGYCKCDACKSANNQFKAPLNSKARQTPEAKKAMQKLNRAYKDTDNGKVKRRAAHALRKARKVQNAPEAVSDLKLLETIYRFCPEGYQVDHIIPLSKNGTHHPDNLQYLPAAVNNSKRASLNYDCSEHALRWQDALEEPSTTIP
jgi:hypothetical protein